MIYRSCIWEIVKQEKPLALNRTNKLLGDYWGNMRNGNQFKYKHVILFSIADRQVSRAEAIIAF